MKRIPFIGTLATILTATVGCASHLPSADEKSITIAHVHAGDHAIQRCGMVEIENYLQLDEGTTVQYLIDGVVGNEQDILDQVDSGEVDLTITAGSFLAQWEPRMAVFDAPFLFSDYRHAGRALADGSVQEIYRSLEEKSNLTILGAWYYGSRHLTSNKPVNSPEDAKGMKIRVTENPIQVKTGQILGGEPTPMSLGEVYLGLQQGVIDAQENPIPTIDTQKFAEVQEILNVTDHIINYNFVVASDELMDRLGPENDAALRRAIEELSLAVQECIFDDEDAVLASWQEGGNMKINDNVDRSLFEQRATELLFEGDEFEMWRKDYERIKSL